MDRLLNQPGATGLLSTTACPASYVTTCPLYRGEITVVPGRNEMRVWFVSADSSGDSVDQGIWQSENSGSSWTQISDLALSASLIALFVLALLLGSCGGGGSNPGSGGGGGGQQHGTQPGTDTMRVIGISGTLSHQSATVTLIVNQ